MVGLSDSIGRLVLLYVRKHGERARFIIGDDVSRAIGKHDWHEAHRLNRVALRLQRMEMVGYLDRTANNAGGLIAG